MDGDDKMNVDMDTLTALPSSSDKKGSSIEKQAKLELPQEQMAELIVKMNYHSSRPSAPWEPRFHDAASDTLLKVLLFSEVMVRLTEALDETDLKEIVIPPKELSQACALVSNFNDKELKDWEDGVRKGIKEKNWGDLIAHRKPPIPSNAVRC
jgi:hypothetical protein